MNVVKFPELNFLFKSPNPHLWWMSNNHHQLLKGCLWVLRHQNLRKDITLFLLVNLCDSITRRKKHTFVISNRFYLELTRWILALSNGKARERLVRWYSLNPNLSQFTMESILDFEKELDVPFLDKVVTSFYRGSGPEVSPPWSAVGFRSVLSSFRG